MLKIAIVVIAIVAMLSNIPDPTLRPWLDAATWLIGASTMFALGVRFDDWLSWLASRPRRNRAAPATGRRRLQISN